MKKKKHWEFWDTQKTVRAKFINEIVKVEQQMNMAKRCLETSMTNEKREAHSGRLLSLARRHARLADSIKYIDKKGKQNETR